MSDHKELVKALRETAKHLDGISRFPYDDDPAKRIYSKNMADAAAAIEALQAQLPKRGKWKKISQHKDSTSDYECSACLGIIEDVPDDDEHPLVAYCPNCGAKMEVQDGE